LYRARYLVTIYTPKEAHSRIFLTGGSFLARQKVAEKSITWQGKLYLVGDPITKLFFALFQPDKYWESFHRLFGYPTAIDQAWPNKSGGFACCSRDSRSE
jgi:hypothetical protein